ncbi:MAG: hypothetical protein REI93_04435 [Pedobacter sp.]|nr:hypothetical protein [Pedobacter sp.]
MNDFYDKEQCQTAVVFFSNYTYSISSPDPKCNGYYNGDPSTWKKRGELILLNDHNAKHTLVLKGNQMTETTAGEENGVLYTFVRTYTAVPK